jgi:hypothetical protein
MVSDGMLAVLLDERAKTLEQDVATNSAE